MRKYYPGITLFKLVGALLVLMGHVHVPELYHQYGRVPGLQQASFFVIPCFYMVAGFLAYKGWTNTTRPQVYMGRYLGGLAAAYVVLSGLALLLGNGAQAVYAAGALHNMVLPLLNVYLVVGPYGTLWFIPPLLSGIALCYYFEQRRQLGLAIGLAVAGFATAQLLAGTGRVALEAILPNPAFYHWRYSGLLQAAVINYLGRGWPLILAGVLVARHEAAFVALPAWKLAALALGSLGLECGLLSWLAPADQPNPTYPLIVSTLPLSMWLFYSLLHVKGEGVRQCHRPINQFSAALYFLHLPLLPVSMAMAGLTGSNSQLLTPGQTLLVMLLTVLQVMVVLRTGHWLLARRRSALAEA